MKSGQKSASAHADAGDGEALRAGPAASEAPAHPRGREIAAQAGAKRRVDRRCRERRMKMFPLGLSV